MHGHLRRVVDQSVDHILSDSRFDNVRVNLDKSPVIDAALPRPLRVPRAVNVLGLVLCLVLAFTLPPLSVVAMLAAFLIGVGGRAFVLAGRDRPPR